MPRKKAKLEEIAVVIFQDGNNSYNSKNLHNHLRVWFKILRGCVHHMPLTKSLDYINTNNTINLIYPRPL